MSKQTVEAIIGKAVLDGEFRQALFVDPAAALAGYDLTPDEAAALKSLDSETLEAFAGALDQRISKSIPVGIYAEGSGWTKATGKADPGGKAMMQHLPQGA